MLKNSTILLVFLSFSDHLNVNAQDSLQNSKYNYSISSPYNTVLTHLKYLQDESYVPFIAGKVFDPEYISNEKVAIALAIKLKQVLDGKGMYIDLEAIPKSTNYIDSTSHLSRYYLDRKEFPNLYLEKVESKWYYSRRTVENIPNWHKEVYPYGIDKLINIIPKYGHNKYLGLYLWQIAIIFLMVLGGFIIHKIFTLIIEKVFLKIFHRFGYERIAEAVVIPIAKPVSYLIVFFLIMVFTPALQLPITMNRYIILALRAIWPVFAIIFFYRLVDLLSLYFKKLTDKTEGNLDDQLVPLVRKVLKTFVIVVGFLFILDKLDVNIMGILAGLSIGGLAFALAAQDTIKNFFGSLMIFIDKPFQVGDWITSGDIDGTVEEVGFRSTRVRTFRNSVTYVPNGVLSDRTIDNHGLRVYRRFFTKLTITYDTPPELIELFVDGLKKIVKDHPKTKKDVYEIHFNEMLSSSLDIMFYIFFIADTWSDELKARHEVLLSIMKLAKVLGVNFAFPTQTLHMESFPEKKGNSPEYEKDIKKLVVEMEEFISKNKGDIDKRYQLN